MKKRTWQMLAAFFTFMLLTFFSCLIGLCILSYGLFVNRCLPWECAPQRNFAVTDLSIPNRFFPSTARVGVFGPTSESLGSVEHASMTVYWRQGRGRSIYMVQRFATIDHARKMFNTYWSDGVLPASPEISYRSSTADSYRVGCGYSEFGGERCELLARYDEFVIIFNVTPDYLMTTQKFEEIVIFIDDQISKEISSP